MRQHLHVRRRARRLQRADGRVTTVGLAAILAAATMVSAPASALSLRLPREAPLPSSQGGCTIHVAYAHLGTPRDDSLHVPAHIQASVSDVRGTYAGWGARIEIPTLKLNASADTTGRAELVVPATQLVGRDSLLVVVRGLAHRMQTVTVHVTPGTVVTITAALCDLPNGPLGMSVVTTNARPGVACHLSLTQPYPRTQRHGADTVLPALIRATITDTAGAPVEQAMVMLAIYRRGSGASPFAYTDSQGRATLAIPGKQLTNLDSTVISVRRIGFGAQRLAVQIVPGDTGLVSAVLCPLSTLQVDFVETRPRGYCGADSDAVRLVHRFITGHPEFQAEHHMAPIDSATVQLLTDAHDATICRTFNDAVSPEDQWTYVRAGNYYFIIVPRRRVQSGDGRWYFPEWRPIAVFDRALNFIGVEGI